MGCWSNGVLEWLDGGFDHIIPLFHYSSTPFGSKGI
jgi:hypothetical protein